MIYTAEDARERVSEASKNSLAPGLVSLEYLETLKVELLSWYDSTERSASDLRNRIARERSLKGE